MKKNILLLMLLIILTVSNIVYNESKIPKEIILSEKQIQKYDSYKISLSENTTAQEIIELCEETEREIIQTQTYNNEHIILTMESDKLSDFLYKYDTDMDIVYINNFLYIFYKSYDNENVGLTYDNQGFKQLVIYNKAKNDMTIIDNQPGYLYGIIFKNNQPIRGRHWKQWKHHVSTKVPFKR